MKKVAATNWRVGQAFETGQWQVVGDFEGREVVVCLADGKANAERIVEDFLASEGRERIMKAAEKVLANGAAIFEGLA